MNIKILIKDYLQVNKKKTARKGSIDTLVIKHWRLYYYVDVRVQKVIRCINVKH